MNEKTKAILSVVRYVKTPNIRKRDWDRDRNVWIDMGFDEERSKFL
jgi:hypothetical protein